jgi:hypothetical protein
MEASREEMVMTHDELLAKIENNLKQCTCEGAAWGGGCYAEENIPWKALRAVVELHKPVINALPDKTCLACQDLYPCQTIQAIEKELA